MLLGSNSTRPAILRRFCIVQALAAAAALLRLPAACAEESWLTEYPTVTKQANAACKEGRLQECRSGLQRLRTLVDGRPDISCRLAVVEAQLGNRALALESLGICARSGLDFGAFTSESALQELRVLPGFSAVQAEYRRGSLPARDYESRYSLGDPDLIAEDIAFDPADGSFLVSSVRERKIVRIAADGSVSDFITTARFPMWGAVALALDSRRGILWTTTTAGPESPPYAEAEDGRSAVLQIDLRSKALLGRYELSDGQPHAFGDMTLGGHGEVYVSDSRGGGVYAIRPVAKDGLQVILKPGSFRSPQTPALLPGGGALLVPDYSRGIGIVSLARGGMKWLQHPPELDLAGIDGLYLHGSTLFAIQNGTAPERILVMTLDAGGNRVERWRVAVARVPGLGDPTHGVVRGEYFYFLVNSGWDRVGDDGSLKADPAATPAGIWRVRLPR